MEVTLDRARTVGRMQTILPDRNEDSSDEERKQELPRARPSAYDLLQERRSQVVHSGMDEDLENEVSQVYGNQDDDEYPVREVPQ